MRCIFLLTMAAGLCMAAPVIETEAFCSTYTVEAGVLSDSGLTSCSVGSGGYYGGGSQGIPGAGSEVWASLKVNGMEVSGTAYVAVGGNASDSAGSYETNAFASGLASAIGCLYTDGEIRPGYIVLDVHTETSINSLSPGALEVRVGSYYVDWWPHGSSFYDVLPFTLGQPFDVGISTRLEKRFDWGSQDFVGRVENRAALSFSIFEEDGVTPVAVLDAPEPSAFAALLAALPAAIIYHRRRRV